METGRVAGQCRTKWANGVINLGHTYTWELIIGRVAVLIE